MYTIVINNAETLEEEFRQTVNSVKELYNKVALLKADRNTTQIVRIMEIDAIGYLSNYTKTFINYDPKKLGKAILLRFERMAIQKGMEQLFQQ